jgi:hypothetical protein
MLSSLHAFQAVRSQPTARYRVPPATARRPWLQKLQLGPHTAMLTAVDTLIETQSR